MSPNLTITVMGDLNIEIASELNEHAFVSLDHDVLVYRDVRPTIGGTAANFALASLPYFRETHVIGKLGADDFGAIITRQLEGSGIHMHCSAIQSTPTGMAIYLRDANSSRPKGTRFLIVQPNAANQALTAADVEQQASVLANSDLFVLDGYCMLTQPRRDASLLAMQIAHSGSALVVFDIVPHTAYRMYGLDMLESITALADVIIVEVGAIRHFLGLSVPIGTLEIDIALATAEVLRSRYPQKAFLLRFGFGDCDQSLVCPPNNEPRHSFTGYKDATESRGFGDTLTARELAENAPLLRTTMNHRSGE